MPDEKEYDFLFVHEVPVRAKSVKEAFEKWQNPQQHKLSGDVKILLPAEYTKDENLPAGQGLPPVRRG